MQLPTPRTPVSRCIALGMYCPAMLAKFPRNAVLGSLASTLGAATGNLDTAQKAYAAAVLALIPKRVAVKYADHVSDKVVRGVQRQAEIADDKKGGKIGAAIFPGGVTPIIRPVGNTQVIEMRALEGRLEAAGALWPSAMAEKGKIMAERIAYETALTERRTAMETAADLRAKRDAAKEDFLDVYAATAARVKAEFPRDRPMQDLFFDRVTDAVVADADDADDEAPAAQPGPATPGAAEPVPAPPA